MTRVAITSDLHADDYAGIPGRFDDILGTVSWVGRKARELGCEALIVAGDYTESKQPARGPRVVKIARALAEGPERQIHVRGNHDGEWRGESIVTDLARTPGWTGYGVPGFELVGDVAVCVIPFLDRMWWRAQPGNEMKPETDAFRDLAAMYVVIASGLYVAATDAGATAAILVGHQQLADADLNDTQRSFLGDVDLVVNPHLLTSIGYSAVIFGHVHRGQTVIDDSACPVLYAGSIERVDFAEEKEEKSFLVVDVDPSGLLPVKIERIPTPARRYVTLDFDDDPDMLDFEDKADGAVVRVLNAPPDIASTTFLRDLGRVAFAVTSVKQRPIEVSVATGGMSESLSAEEALSDFFADDPDRDVLVALGREILAEVA